MFNRNEIELKAKFTVVWLCAKHTEDFIHTIQQLTVDTESTEPGIFFLLLRY